MGREEERGRGEGRRRGEVLVPWLFGCFATRFKYAADWLVDTYAG